MKHPFLLAVLLSALIGCATVPPVPKTRFLLGDQEFKAGNGAFAFTDVILIENKPLGSWIITWIVRNNTGRDWNRVIFDFELYDMTRSVLSSYIDSPITVIVYSFQNGQEQRFGTNYFKPLWTDVFQSVWKYEVTYKSPLTFVMVKPWESRELLYEDQAIRICFALSEKQIGMVLQNKTPSPIIVDWNILSYVDITGLAHGVMHTGVRYIERDRPQVPTTIPPAAMIDDVIIPSDHISYTAGSGGGWSSRPLFPRMAETDLYLGKSFSVFMPLEIDGTVKNYLFAFRIEREAP